VVAAAADAGNQAIVQGKVTRDGSPVPDRLRPAAQLRRRLRRRGAAGRGRRLPVLRRPRHWTLRVLAPGGVRAERAVSADIGQVTELEVAV
jgi:hypothetical protein